MAELIPIPSPRVPLFWGERGAPLVVLVHDWYGRLPWLAPYAQALAHEGYRVAVPDLYPGVATLDEGDAEQLMAALDVATALAELDGIITEARAEGSVRAAVIGFSLGGWLGLLHAQGGSVDAAVAYYATLGSKDHGVIPCPLLLHFAQTDEWSEGEDPESFIDRLNEHGTPVTAQGYAATVHSFANASVSEKVNPAAAALAYARTAAFLRDHLLD